MEDSENAELNYCYNCMARLGSGQTVCPECGHDNSLYEKPESALPAGTILAGKYLVGRVLGQGGFGITYLGYDTALNIKVAIKEYFPYGIGVRAVNSIRVTAVASQVKAEGFRKGCDEFQEEARRLAAIESQNIVKVREYFRENGTAYIVMSFLDGNSLTKEVAANGGKIPWDRVVDLFKPLILEIDKLHERHLIHRDIKPDNIKVVKEKDGTEHLVLLDFGAARNFVSAEVTGTYSAMVTHGYAPVEQYSPKSRQGPYTDIYALCATMYAVITGHLPATATDRMTGEADIKTFAEMGVEMPPHIEKAIFHGLEVRGQDRPQSMRELYEELEGKEPEAKEGRLVPVEEPAPEPLKEEKPAAAVKPAEIPGLKKKAKWLLPVLLAVLAAAGFFLFRGTHRDQLNSAEVSTQTPAAETQRVTDPPETEPAPAGPGETQTAIHLRETEASIAETQAAIDIRLTAAAATQTKVAEPTATSTAEPTAAPTAAATEAASETDMPAVPVITDTPEPGLKIGDIITLGQYEQDGDLTNGPEPIEWQVMQVEDGRALVLSLYGLDTKQYHEKYESATWETCDLRAWLNGEFYNNAFSSEEKGRIREETLKNPNNAQYGTKGGNDTTDRIFLLSIEEANRYLKNVRAGACQPTDFAVNNGAITKNEANAYYATIGGEWWLRSPGARDDFAACYSGSVQYNGHGFSTLHILVRPAFWLDLTAETDIADITEPAAGTELEPVPAPTEMTVKVSDLREGDILTLGHYEQDGDLNNGTEAIEWQVLAVEEDRALVLSKYGLDAQVYNGPLDAEHYKYGVTWETSGMRKWLNGEFYDSAFSGDEKGLIREETLKNPDNPEYGTKGGNDTTDRIFLLSIDEAEQYFEYDEARKCWATIYAKNNGAEVSKLRGSDWWLRSPGTDNNLTVFVTSGSIHDQGYRYDLLDKVARPAFWLDLTGNTDVTILRAEEPVYTNTAKPAGVLKSGKEIGDAKAGDIIMLGRYEQDGDLSNGAEVIEWQVLTVEDGRALVISRYCLDAKPYHEEQTGVTWETSTLRAWLNGEFYNSAFSSEEMGRIREESVWNQDNTSYGTKGGNDTTDRIFLLSYGEVGKYFADSEARICGPTTYAIDNGAWVNKSSGTTWWWSRSPGSVDDTVIVIRSDGLVSYYNVNDIAGPVRPAFWMELTGETDITILSVTEPALTGTPEPAAAVKSGLEIIEAKEGDVITLGKYEQDNDLTNGAEAIEWQVLAVEDGGALVISRYGLDAKPYHEKEQGVTWETSTLRVWLNGEFYNSAFSSEEKGHIRLVTLKNPDNVLRGTKGGNDTSDRIFLLSMEEAHRYFAYKEERRCRPTTYAIENGAGVLEGNGDWAWWWLRSPGFFEREAAIISEYTAEVYDFGREVYIDSGSVRPAFWLDLPAGTGTAGGTTLSETVEPTLSSGELYDIGKAAYDDGDYAKALEYLGPAAEAGYADAQNYLGMMYQYGYGVEQSNEEAVKWYRLSADQGFAAAQSKLGSMYHEGYGVEQSYEEAVKWYKLAADQGDANAQNNLGYMYQYGYGVEQSYEEAAKWIQLAAEHGDAPALDNLGRMYEKGYGVEQSYKEAARLYQLAADQGFARAQTHLGWLYRNGYGVEQSYKEAARLYQLAADQGNESAQYNLGYFYQNGYGIDQSYEEALKWYQLAADQGYAAAQNQLGLMYYHGLGVEQSYEEAARWLKRSADQGNETAQSNLEILLDQFPDLKQVIENMPAATAAAAPTATAAPAASFNQTAETGAASGSAKAGNFITLGHYEQDGNTANGAEAIEWQVLTVEDGRALVISRYSLDAMPYNTENQNVTWETSTLRAWLNGEFFSSAFSDAEQSRIREATLKNPDNPSKGTEGGKDTTDRIFLLSIEEAEQYFPGDEARKSRPTAYAVSRGAGDKDSETVWWWLRSPGSSSKNAAGVNNGGAVRVGGGNVNYNSGTARPAFWLDLTAETDTAVLPSEEPIPADTSETDTAAVTETDPAQTNIPETAASAGIGDLEAGDFITLGHYEQDGDLSNGPEAIEWQVLSVEDGRALVISKYALDTKPYNEKDESVTWETCTLRAWLNGEFYNGAFSDEEKGRIRQVTLKNPDNEFFGTKGGNDTTDRIFLLSIDEAENYFADKEARKCRPTINTENNGAWVYEDTGTTWWWLRSPGFYDNYAASVDAFGVVGFYGSSDGVDFSGSVVRPAFWLDL